MPLHAHDFIDEALDRWGRDMSNLQGEAPEAQVPPDLTFGNLDFMALEM